jgi:hypothetical protein
MARQARFALRLAAPKLRQQRRRARTGKKEPAIAALRAMARQARFALRLAAPKLRQQRRRARTGKRARLRSLCELWRGRPALRCGSPRRSCVSSEGGSLGKNRVLARRSTRLVE